MYRLRKLLNPEIFQGKYKDKCYFEGWYFRIVDSRMENSYAIIPGISLGEWDSHAFIQVLDMNNKTSYFRFDLCEFEFSENRFEISIGDNYFSQSRMHLNLKNKDLSIQGDLYFTNIMEFPKTICHPSVMGMFTYLPLMECYHDVINIQHDIIGHLLVSDKTIDFTDGKGYIEKNWGKSMPDSYVWVQSNHFDPDDVTVMCCIAKVPCLCMKFYGFITLFRFRDRIFLFSTYTGARIRKLYYNNNHMRITVQDLRFRLDLLIIYNGGGELKAPLKGSMKKDIMESIDAVVKIRFSDRAGNVLYEGYGTNAGLEIVE